MSTQTLDFSQKTDGEIALIIVDLEDVIRQYSQIVQVARQERAKRLQVKQEAASIQKTPEPTTEPDQAPVINIQEN